MFGRSLQLFRLYGFPIRVDASWLILFVLVTWSLAVGLFPQWYGNLSPTTYWLMGLAGSLGLFVSIIIHEMAHALVARRRGMPMGGITLFIFGGVAEMRDEPPTPATEFWVAVAGPAASVALGVVCGLVAGWGVDAWWSRPVTGVLAYLAIINFILVAFNIIPAFPLDGGRVLRSALWRWKNDLRKATRIASEIGAGFGAGLIVLGVISLLLGNFVGGLWFILLGFFLRQAAQASYQQVLVRRALAGEPVARFMRSDPRTVPPTATVDQLVNDFLYRDHHKMYPVTEEGNLLGCVTIDQIKNVPRDRWPSTTMREILVPPAPERTIQSDRDALDALQKMSRNQQSRLMVVRNGHLEGVLTLKDLLAFISLKVELEGGEARALGGLMAGRA